jgi:dienelactone hydrolase
LLVSLGGGAVGQTDIERLPRGQIVERIVALTDTAQHYAVYVPSFYDTTRAWPVLFAMDPRGRALVPLHLFQRAAERLGYIVLSSYNTASDVIGESPNEAAFAAMLEDAQRRFVVHPNRVYITGFSGTARASWLLARRLRGAAAGIILAGAGLPTPLADPIVTANWDTTLAVFAAAGRWDFNYEEVLELDGQLDRVGFPHHVRFFDGPHSWFPDSLAAEALEFMALYAMRRGTAPIDTTLVLDEATERLRAAEHAEQHGDDYTALRWYRAALEDLRGLIDLPGAQQARERLSDSRAVREAVRRRERASAAHVQKMREFEELRQRIRTTDHPPDGYRVAEELGIEALNQTARVEAGTYEGDAARRVLESIFVVVSFYDPRSYFDREEWERALAVLEVAHRIHPEQPRVCFDLARAYARTDAPDRAVEALACAAASGQVEPDTILRHPDMQALRGRGDFEALLKRMGR